MPIVCFAGRMGNQRGILTMSLDGSNRRAITDEKDRGAYPSWSRKGSMIAFECGRDGNPEIYRVNADGTGKLRLTENPDLDEWPAWSQDGLKIVFASGVEGDKDYWIMNADGSGKERLTEDVFVGDAFPSWSPDGSKIAITTAAENVEPEIFVIDIVTKKLSKIGKGSAPSWSPF